MLVTEMTIEECRAALSVSGYGRLACARENKPYVVPIFFAIEGADLYAFSMAGQKIDWMRSNPHVCLEIDSVKSWDDWTCVVVFGRYEELGSQAERTRAFGLLQQRAMWWQPGAVFVAGHGGRKERDPVFFRIAVQSSSGHRARPSPDEAAARTRAEHTRGGWWTQLFRSQ